MRPPAAQCLCGIAFSAYAGLRVHIAVFGREMSKIFPVDLIEKILIYYSCARFRQNQLTVHHMPERDAPQCYRTMRDFRAHCGLEKIAEHHIRPGAQAKK
ncbi:hypothetical protein SAMN02745857_03347 [Andreprevotia lacus DSM 23236]|jgi:hypothetical protein|uniref:Uncharacterized protein n=1 Tax=Andreprevotia lacus DSM 23236 TaxID=1121001 RepID=A0A1W1XXP9_9NEIS|nr:hypothetical protein [Andreprevotia lacus]SMC28637.1 hypothetical protein SAMN02745857_03347 [Andreprevotia lacus DSM 23236]